VNDSPTGPSSASVVDGQKSQETEGPPYQVVIAVRLAAINYAFGLMMIVAFWDYFSTIQTAGSLIWNQALSVAFSVWIYYKIYIGRNWARITLLVVGGLLVLMATSRVFTDKFMELVAPAPPVVKMHMMIAPAITLTILWLLFLSAGRHWFRRRRLALPPNKSLERTREG
jgi:hypothetical protein